MGDEIKQLIDMVANLKVTMEDGFKNINEKFEDIDKRFEDIDKRFEAIEKRFEDIDKRFDKIDERFDAVDKRFDILENAVRELNSNQIKIMNSTKLIEKDVRNNTRHIHRLEEKESFI